MATGDLLALWGAYDNEPPAANYATLDTRNAHPVLDFDDTTDEAAIFSGVLPPNYAGGGLTAKLHYAMTSATTGKIRWDASVERLGETQDMDADSFASAQSVNVAAVDGTSGVLDVASVAFTSGAQMDSLAAGEGFRIKIERKPSDTTNDTATGDAELRFLALYET